MHYRSYINLISESYSEESKLRKKEGLLKTRRRNKLKKQKTENRLKDALNSFEQGDEILFYSTLPLSFTLKSIRLGVISCNGKLMTIESIDKKLEKLIDLCIYFEKEDYILSYLDLQAHLEEAKFRSNQ